MKDELPPQVAALLQRARTAHDPSAADLERVRVGVLTAVAAPVALAGAATAHAELGATGASAATGASGLGLKLLAAGLLVGAGVTWASLDAPASHKPPAAPPPSVVTPLAAPADAPPEAPSTANDGELALMRSILAALRDGEAARALTLLEEHARRFPQGVLSPERRGLRVVALCEAGQTALGREERAAFLRVEPDSPLAQRVRSACKDAP
jgi:hypothetical protein